MTRVRFVLALSMATAMLALAGCSPAGDGASGAWSAYGGTWEIEQIVRFPSEQKVVGTIADVGSEYRAVVDGNAGMVWIPVTINVTSASPEITSEQFVARVLPSYEGQPVLSLFKVGQHVLYLGDPIVHDTSNPGPAAGTVSWLLTIDASGQLGATAQQDGVHGNIKDYAAELGLTLPSGLFGTE